MGTGWLEVAAADANHIWIAGIGENGLRFDGQQWSVFSSPLLRTRGIWAASPTDVWLVGATTGYRPAIARGDGQTFQIVDQPDDTTFFSDIWGSGPNDVWAVGPSANLLAHWDGASWTTSSALAGGRWVTGNFIDGSGPDDIWLGGWDGLFHFDGTQWSLVPEFDFHTVLAIAVRARNEVWVSAIKSGDAMTTIYRYDGQSWTPTHSMRFDTATIYGVAARSSDDAWAVGVRSAEELPNRVAGFLLHWDGHTWTRAPDPPAGMRAIVDLPGTHIAVGDAGQVLQLSSQPTPTFTSLNPSPLPALEGVWGSSASDMWAVGLAGAALHYDGNRVQESPTGVSTTLFDVWGTGPDDVWAVGEYGMVLRKGAPTGVAGSGPSGSSGTSASSGSPWVRVPADTTTTLRAVFTAARDQAWIGGDGGLFFSNGNSTEAVVVPGLSVNATIYDIHGVSPENIWAAGEDTAGAFVTHFDGTVWSAPEIIDRTGVGVARIWMVGAHDVWGNVTSEARDHGPENTWHYDGSAWTARFVGTPSQRWMFPDIPLDNGIFLRVPRGTFALSQHDVWAVSGLGTMVRHLVTPE